MNVVQLEKTFVILLNFLLKSRWFSADTDKDLVKMLGSNKVRPQNHVFYNMTNMKFLRYFKKYDADQSGELDKSECRKLIKDLAPNFFRTV